MLEPSNARLDARFDAASDGLTADCIAGLYREQAPRLLRLFRRRSRSADEPADLLHEAFARLAKASPHGLLRNPEAYLQRIVRNLLIDRARRAANRVEHVPIGPDFDVPVAAEQHQAIEASDVKRLYRMALDALPPRTRQVFLMHRVEDLPYQHIAERLGLSVRTVEWHIGEALVRIARALDAALAPRRVARSPQFRSQVPRGGRSLD